MSRASKIKRILAAITRMIPAWVALAALVIAVPCAMCFAPDTRSHPCCSPGAGDYLHFEAAGCIGCQSISASMVASIDNRKDVAPRTDIGGPSALLRVTSAWHETITQLPASPPTVDTQPCRRTCILQI
jgi:hypothetical protein